MKATLNTLPAVAERFHPALRRCALAPLRLVVLYLLGLGTSAFGDTSPTLIPFQGRLTDQQGRAYNSGQYTIVFTLYDLAVGGSTLWTETHQKVGVINGMVNVFLGSITPLDSVDFSQTRHLGITIDADDNRNTPDPEMVPRQMIIPAFWARQADNATKLQGNDWSAILYNGATNARTGQIDGARIANATISQAQIGDRQINARTLADGAVTVSKLTSGVVTGTALADGAVTSQKIADGTVALEDLSVAVVRTIAPPGTIVAFGGDGATAPTGWLFCNGDSVPVSSYRALYDAIGEAWGSASYGNFRLPDLRGVFLRGKNGDRRDAYADPDVGPGVRHALQGGNSGNHVGSFQSDSFEAHNHKVYSTTEGGSGEINRRVPSPFSDSTVWTTTFTRSDSLTDLYAGEELQPAKATTETRPKNAYVNYIIKY